MRVRLLFIVLIFCVSKVNSQNVIEGQVISSKGNNLPYSSILIKGTLEGTTANSEGLFLINIEDKHLKDSLIISHLGFKNYKNSIENITAIKIRIFNLEESISTLDEIVIENVNAKDIALEAFSKFEINHPKQDYNVFFRSYGAKNGEWKRFIEASLYIKGLELNPQNNNKYQVFLNEIRKSKDFFRESTTKTNPYDEIKYLLLFNPKKYNYLYKGSTTYNGFDVYEIDFKPKSGLFEGKLFIDKKTKGFVKIAYNSTEKSNSKYLKGKIKIKGEEIKTYLTYGKWEVAISFKKDGESFVFERIKHSIIRNHFKRSNKYMLLFSHSIFSEMYFSKSNISTNNKILLSPKKHIYNIELPYNKSFWNNYNAVVRDSIQKTVIKILEE